VSILKINTQVWLSYMKKMTITLQMKEKSMAQRTDIRRNLKRHISLVSSAKFGGHALRHLASRLANEGGSREADQKLSFSDFLKIHI